MYKISWTIEWNSLGKCNRFSNSLYGYYSLDYIRRLFLYVQSFYEWMCLIYCHDQSLKIWAKISNKILGLYDVYSFIILYMK
jgi:hypothetical protein